MTKITTLVLVLLVVVVGVSRFDEAAAAAGGVQWGSDAHGGPSPPAFLQKDVGNHLVGSIFGSGGKQRVEGTMCNIDVVELANTEQLHSILRDLVQMTYFRLIRVNVNGRCDRELANVAVDGHGAGATDREAVSYTHLTLPTKRIV